MDTIERAARAMWARYERDLMEIPSPQPFEKYADNWRDLARTAIEALREPTEAQYDALCATDKMWRELDSKTVWQTYIDAALKDGA